MSRFEDAGSDLMASQVGMWFAQQLDPASPALQIAECLEVHGPVDPGLFEAAIRRMVAEAETLRLRFTLVDGAVRQFIEPPETLSLRVHDVSAEPDPLAAALERVRADVVRPVDLENGPLYTTTVFPAGPDRIFWSQQGHHLVSDGYGGFLMVRRAAEIYSALAEGRQDLGTPLPPVRHLLEQDAAYRASAEFVTDRAYWAEVLSGRPEPVSLSGRFASASHTFLRHSVQIAPAQADRLRGAARRLRAAMPVLVMAAAGVYTGRLTGTGEAGIWIPGAAEE